MATTALFSPEAFFEKDTGPKEVQPYIFEALEDSGPGRAAPPSQNRGAAPWSAAEGEASAPARAQQSVFTADQVQAKERQALERGAREGERKAREDFEKAREAERSGVSAALNAFVSEREKYLRQVESEVVSLALSIARKILYREAQVDPLFLAGAVRVSLEKIAAGTRVTLRVHPAQVEDWKAFLARHVHMDPAPQVVADGFLTPVDCVVETELGTTALSLEAQLKEIEQGFLDLLAVRPGR